MRKFFLIIGFVLNCILSQGQESILKLESGRQYQVVFVDVLVRDDEHENLDSIRNGFVRWDKSNSFLINDKLTLDKLQANWIGKRTNEFYFCWYNYFIYVVEDGKLVDELRVNEECKQVVCKHGVFNYATTIVDKLDKSNVVPVARISFDSVPVGRQFHANIQNESNILAPPGEHDEWIKYDGKMTITMDRRNVKKMQSRLERSIKHDFPDEVFEITQSGSGPDNIDYIIYCSKNIGTNLKGYKIFIGWRELKPSVITLFAMKMNSIENALKKCPR
jgi:hypothetical protein